MGRAVRAGGATRGATGRGARAVVGRGGGGTDMATTLMRSCHGAIAGLEATAPKSPTTSSSWIVLAQQGLDDLMSQRQKMQPTQSTSRELRVRVPTMLGTVSTRV